MSFFRSPRERAASNRAHDRWQDAQESAAQAEIVRIASEQKAQRIADARKRALETRALKKRDAVLANPGALPRYIARSLRKVGPRKSTNNA